MDYRQMYQDKLVTAEAAIEKCIEPGDGMIYPIFPGEPQALHKALNAYSGLENNRLFRMLASEKTYEHPKDKLKQYSFFLSGSDRQMYAEGKVELIPNNFHDIPTILESIVDQKVIMCMVSPMDDHGFFSLGTHNSYVGPLLNSADKILVEVSEHVPYTFGERNYIHVSQVDAIVENNCLLPEMPEPPMTEVDEAIGRHVAEIIQDGDVLQVGVGAMPNAVLRSILHKKDLGMHTEMISERVVDLMQAGVLTGKYKTLFPGVVVSSLVAGTKRLYDYMHMNPLLFMVPISEANSIANIAKVDNFISVNATIQVDFMGQCNSETLDGRYYSSSGGQADFTRAAHYAKNGRSVMVLHSTAAKGTVSTIVPRLYDGAAVTTIKNDVDMVATEYGVARLKGKSISERTEALIAIAHPKFREELRAEAIKLKFISL